MFRLLKNTACIPLHKKNKNNDMLSSFMALQCRGNRVKEVGDWFLGGE